MIKVLSIARVARETLDKEKENEKQNTRKVKHRK